MPIGISFFTFQAMGYVFDIYMGKHKPAKKLLDFMTYISLFPQLIAGPIIRYSDIQEQLTKRNTTTEKFASGITRFVIGLSKKVLIANTMGAIVDKIQEALGKADGIVINPAAYTHTSVAILDALKAVGIPTVEVHLSDINSREEFRKHSFVSMIAVKTICGLGFEGYRKALEYFA